VREEAPGNGQSATAVLRPWADLTPWRSAILLVAGDKAGQWTRWYRTAIPEAERLYADYLDQRKKEAGS